MEGSRQLRAGFWSATSRRLLFGFGAMLAIFALASALALRGLGEVHDSIHEVRRHEEAVRLSLQLASAVRDQYAHQAHTIIIGDGSHLGFYGHAQQRVVSLAEQVRHHAEDPEERALLDQIERSSAELDDIFRARIVPAVLSGERHSVQFEHDRAQVVVSDIQDRVDRLVGHFEDSIAVLQSRASTVERATYRTSAAALAGTLLLALAIALYIGRSVALPVRRLSEGAARIGAGDLGTRIELDSPDELGDLARQFNAMTASLREQQERLVQSEKLAGIGRLAAGVAHEINNPLGVILGYTKLLAKKADGPAAEDLKVIEDETLRCKEIVEGLLDLSRPLRLQPVAVDLRELAEEVVARLEEASPGAQVRFSVEGAGLAEGSGQKLRQVVFNLVKNAAEAAGPGGAVRVEVAARGGEALLSVTDDGPGLAPEARARLFEPFFTTKASGTGLGLAVSQAIAKAHGGTLDAGSAAPRGAVFTLRLPALAEAAAKEA